MDANSTGDSGGETAISSGLSKGVLSSLSAFFFLLRERNERTERPEALDEPLDEPLDCMFSMIVKLEKDLTLRYVEAVKDDG